MMKGALALCSLPATFGMVLACGLVGQSGAAEPSVSGLVDIDIEQIDKSGVLTLTDGAELCLAGIWSPAAYPGDDRVSGWRSRWREIIGSGRLYRSAEHSAQHDRYGCRMVLPETEDGTSLQRALVAGGWAVVDPVSGPHEPGEIDAMLLLEDRARKAGLGLWSSPSARPKRSDDMSAWVGTRQLVEGRVKRVSVNDRYVYLNFGADWRTDFTLRLNRKMTEAGGFEAAGLEGRTLRARGVAQESRGPLMDITHLKQIELLP